MPVHVDLLLKFARLKFQAEMSSVLLIYSSLFRGGVHFLSGHRVVCRYTHW